MKITQKRDFESVNGKQGIFREECLLRKIATMTRIQLMEAFAIQR